MIFSCWLTKENIVGPCQVKSCMWSSTNQCGCMAYPEPPDMETMTDAELARHKGLLMPELINKRLQANRRIKNILIMNEFLDWCRGKEAPWQRAYNDQKVQEFATRLTTRHWPYTVSDLGWRMRDIAFTFHKPTVDQFKAQVGKQLDWLEVVEFCIEELQDGTKIFKQAHRKNHG